MTETMTPRASSPSEASTLAGVDDQGETMADLDQAVSEAEAAVRDAENAERRALDGAPDAHHKAADLLRWATAKLDGLRALRDARDAERAEQRRADALEEAGRVLDGHHVTDLAAEYREARAAIGRLISACERRNEAITRAARVLRDGGHPVPSVTRPVLTLDSGIWSPADSEPGQVVAELVYDVARNNGLTTSGGTKVEGLMTRAVSPVSRGRVPRAAAGA